MNRFFHDAADPVRINGTVFGGRYRMLRPLGEGGMSTVYLAEDLKLPGKKWAVKRTRESGISELSAAREAAVLMKLSHPYLPHVVDFFPPDEEGYSHLVMEYIDGVTLQQLHERSDGPLPTAALIRYAIQLCELLQYLHEMESGPIIFRDIKPSNIMIDPRDHVRLIDFGIARRQTAERPNDTVALGTVGFAAPELLEEGVSDYRSDLYSLGATLYYLLSGGRFYQVWREPLAIAGGESERQLSELIGRLLEENPENRPESAAQVKELLEQCLESGKIRVGQPTGAGFVPTHEMRRMRIIVGGLYAGAGSTFVAAAIAGVLSDAGVANAVVEHPRVRAELYGLLDGERHAPDGYDAWSGRTEWPSESWRTGRTEWIVHRPEQSGRLSGTALEQRLYKVNASITIVDIGEYWLEPDVAELLDDADVLVAVADPNPSRWMLPDVSKCAQMLMRRRESGRNVHFAANKAVAFKGNREWLDSFPEQPSMVIPCISYEEIVRAAWKGEPVQQQPAVKPVLHKALAAWIGQAIVPLREPGNGWFSSGWLGKFFTARS